MMKRLITVATLLVVVASSSMDSEDLSAFDTLGESEKFPGPFTPIKVASDGTDGYTTIMNHYNDLTTNVHGLDCDGNGDSGKSQTYAEADVPNLKRCTQLCNGCDTHCAGFVDMLEERRCYFVSRVLHTKVAITDAVDIRRKYFNKVKTYAPCDLGNFSQAEAPWSGGGYNEGSCIDCLEGQYQSFGTMGGKCNICPGGKYSNYGLKPLGACTDCPAGKIPNDDATACNDCPVTQFSLEGSAYCSKCPQGRFGDKPARTGTEGGPTECGVCIRGKWANSEGFLACKDCPGGYISDTFSFENRTGSFHCDACPAGKYSQGDQTSGPLVCVNCAPGKSTKDNNAAPSCGNCEPGKYATEGESACRICPAGNFSSAGRSFCSECQAGRFAPQARTAAAFNGGASCNLCGPGQFSPPQATSCAACPIGQSSSGGKIDCEVCALGKSNGDLGQAVCSPCSPGWFANTTAMGACHSCPKGKVQDKFGKTACVECEIGKIQETPSQKTCDNCAAGFFQDETGLTVCKGCEAGKHTPATAKNAVCLDCDAGQYTDTTELSTCVGCMPGWYTGQADGANSCTACAAGQQAPAMRTVCTDCSVGTYAPDTGAAACLDCPSGRFMSEEGSNACTACDAGKYQEEKKQIACADCTHGKYSLGASDGTKVCTTCPRGTIATSGQSNSQSSSCTECAAGTFSPHGHHSSVCNDCEKGKFIVATGSDRCDNCVFGQFQDEVGENACKDCPVGRQEGQEAKSVCAKCEFGKFQSEVGKPECEVCPVQKHMDEIGGAACKACPGGTVSAPGNKICLQCEAGKSPPFEERLLNQLGETLGGCQGRVGCVETDVTALCKSCDAGKAIRAGENQCSDCEGGKFSDSAAAECDPCPAGRWVAEGLNTVCTNCAAGKYLLTGGESSSGACKDCQTGKFQSVAGAQVVCENCPAGKKSRNEMGSPACDTCPRGRYAKEMKSSCTVCQNGKYQDATERDACKNCQKGRAGGTTESAKSSNCPACAAGRYQDQIEKIVCKACTSGRYISTTGRQSNCVTCPNGKKSSSGTPAELQNCVNCPSGQVPTSNKVGCEFCPIGKQKGAGQPTNLAGCQACGVGTYRQGTNSDNTCSQCPAGKWMHNLFATSNNCQSCPGGKFSVAGSNDCTQCGAGMEMIGQAVGGSCRNCPSGRFKPGASTLTCREVSKGFYKATSRTGQVSCQAGTYQDVAGQDACKSCSVKGDGKKHYQDLAQQTTCKECAVGFTPNSGRTGCTGLVWIKTKNSCNAHRRRLGCAECKAAIQSYGGSINGGACAAYPGGSISRRLLASPNEELGSVHDPEQDLFGNEIQHVVDGNEGVEEILEPEAQGVHANEHTMPDGSWMKNKDMAAWLQDHPTTVVRQEGLSGMPATGSTPSASPDETAAKSEGAAVSRPDWDPEGEGEGAKLAPSPAPLLGDSEDVDCAPTLPAPTPAPTNSYPDGCFQYSGLYYFNNEGNAEGSTADATRICGPN